MGKVLSFDRPEIAAYPGANTFFQEGLRAEEAGDIGAAIGHYRECLRFYPGFVRAFINLGSCYEVTKNHREAYKVLTRGTRISPSHPLLHYNLGCALDSLRRPMESAQSYLKAARLDPFNADIWFNLGRAYIDKKSFFQAKLAFKKAFRYARDEKTKNDSLSRIRECARRIAAHRVRLILIQGGKTNKGARAC